MERLKEQLLEYQEATGAKVVYIGSGSVAAKEAMERKLSEIYKELPCEVVVLDQEETKKVLLEAPPVKNS